MSGLDYFGARYYDSDLGIWNSPDMAREFPNLYAYMGNFRNPLNAVDPSGNATIQSFGRESSEPALFNSLFSFSNIGYRHDQIIFDHPQKMIDGQIWTDIGFFSQRDELSGLGELRKQPFPSNGRDILNKGHIDDKYVVQAINNSWNKWAGGFYNILKRNCQDFASSIWDTAKSLKEADKPFPSRVNTTVPADNTNIKTTGGD